MRAGMLALAMGLLLPRFLPELPAAWALIVLGLLGLLCLLRQASRPLDAAAMRSRRTPRRAPSATGYRNVVPAGELRYAVAG